MIKAIIFDVGGVLIRTHDHGPRRELEERLGLQEWASERLVFSGADGTAAQQGRITNAELWRRIAARLQLDEAQLQHFRTAFWAGDVLDQELVAYVRRLQSAGYQTAIISNATDDLRRLLTDHHQVADAFDLVVCSAEEKVMKPNLEIYRTTLQRLQRKAAETVFVDDNEANVSAARSLGMHAIHYRDGLDVPQALSQLGVDLPSVREQSESVVSSKGEHTND